MAEWTREVLSSSVSQVSYNPDTQQMTVVWTTGKTSIYSGVPEDEAENIANSYSVGAAMHDIRGKYPHRYG